MTTHFLKRGEAIVASSPAPFAYDGLARAWSGKGFVIGDPLQELVAYRIRTAMTPIRFEEQFPIDVQLEIEDRRAYVAGTNPDPVADEMATYQKRVLDLLFGKLKDQRLTEVDVADPSVIAGVDFCQWIGVLTPELAATIKRGIEEPV